MFLHAHLVSLQYRRLHVVAPELVASCHQHLVVTLAFCHAFHAPRLAGMYARMPLVVGDYPVGAYHAVVSGFSTQLVGDYLVIEAVAHVLFGLVIGYCVIRHYGGSLSRRPVELESSFGERYLMRLIAAAGIHCIFAVAVVRVASALARAAARPVLHHRVDAPASPSAFNFVFACRGLEAVAIGSRKVGHELRLRTECAAVAVPARVGAEVGLRRQCRSKSKQTVFRCGDAPELLHYLRRERGGKPQHVAPERYVAAVAGIELRVGKCRMPRVGRIVGGNAVRATLDECLHLVVPPRGCLRALHLRHKHVAQVVLRQEAYLRVTQVVSLHSALGERLSAVSVVRHRKLVLVAVEHQPGNLVDCHTPGKVGGTLLHRKPPVLVGQQLAAAVEALEILAVNLYYLHARFRRIAQCRAVFLYDEVVPVLLLNPNIVSLIDFHILSSGTCRRNGRQSRHCQYFSHIPLLKTFHFNLGIADAALLPTGYLAEEAGQLHCHLVRLTPRRMPVCSIS